MLTLATEKPAVLGWKYPTTSPFQGRIVVRTALAPALMPREEVEPIKLKVPRHLAWLVGGEERVGFNVLGRRVDPTTAPERAPHVAPKASTSAS
ncbi:hypothetical protein [Hyalangium rubrum]|uniref:Uncharacterized protein n=1 Tax=Hyalangium rubrum TaxID=3103134 RepID=A0ABU5HD24_9BACT|nr:hypothetical protein [Hyalangium sp. s54d21]MDY7231363.1 hypothetical protein [Hyalangium sp. s54d21]